MHACMVACAPVHRRVCDGTEWQTHSIHGRQINGCLGLAGGAWGDCLMNTGFPRGDSNVLKLVNFM